MAALRSTLQKSLFQQDSERLLAVANLKKDAKKKKGDIYLCLAVTNLQPVSVYLYFVRLEKEDSFSKRERFALRDVRVVDGINPRKQIADFDLTIGGQLYQLNSNSHEEKDFFIRQLFKLANAYLPVQKPEFVNLSLPVDSLAKAGGAPSQSGAGDADSKGALDNETNYQPISSKEEADFRQLLSRAELQIGQARLFSSVLNEQLAQLDSANLSSIMENEQNVSGLIELVDTAIELADSIEQQLDQYDALLSFVRDSVDLIEEKDSLRHIEQQNNRRLLDELKEFLYLMDMVEEHHVGALSRANLSDPSNINLCYQAARVVDHFLTKKPELNPMGAFQAKVDMLNRLTSEFVDRFYAHICAIFGNMESMLESQNIGEIIIQKHSQRHRALLPFSDLILWLKQTRPTVYSNVLDKYNGEAQKVYKREFDRFFSELADRAASYARGLEGNGHALDESALKAYSDLIETTVAECRNVVESEQKFCIRFFHLNADVIAQLAAEMSNNDSSSVSSGKTLEKQLNEQIKFAIGRIFEQLPLYFYALMSICKEHHQSILISLYVLLSRKLGSQDPSSYFSIVYGSFLVAQKRLFDEQMTQIEDSFAKIRISKKSRVGILDSIARFQSFASSANQIFGNSERRMDLDKWLEKLTDAVVEGIKSAAESANSKYPAAIVRLENLHAFYSCLSELKIPCLDSRRKTVRQNYQENVVSYAQEQMGRPLEKIHSFFERIEKLLENGVRAEEVGYEQQFSRIELKRAISAHPAREVKKGLDSLYKKMEKQLCPDSPLVQVVWRQMQEEFLKQIKHYQQLIAACYPGSKIELEVGIEDILHFFSDIAQQH